MGPGAAHLGPLPLAAWEESRLYLQLVCQIVGKTRQRLHPWLNHWWHVTLYVSPRGLTTGTIPTARGPLSIDLDLVDHRAVLSTERARREVALAARPLAEFYAELMAALGEIGRPCSISTAPYDCKSKIPYPEDREHATYDREAVTRAWRVLAEVDAVFWEFRGRFVGKSSPVHFFWHSLDLAVTRFSGRAAPEPPSHPVAREAYSHEVSSAGFWFGDDTLPEPAFYSYAWPVPPELDASPLPAPARWVEAGGAPQARLSYEDWRKLPDPRAALLGFLQSSYEAAAERAHWDRALLERPPRG
jgi:hypothetical protein